jgi:hypothetical protein
VKFWLLLGAAAVAVLFGISHLVYTVEGWDGHSRACGPGCISTPAPLTSGVPGVAVSVALFALAAAFVWIAARVHRKR